MRLLNGIVLSAIAAFSSCTLAPARADDSAFPTEEVFLIIANGRGVEGQLLMSSRPIKVPHVDVATALLCFESEDKEHIMCLYRHKTTGEVIGKQMKVWNT